MNLPGQNKVGSVSVFGGKAERRERGESALDDKVDEFVLHHVLTVAVRNEEANVPPRYGYSSQDDERLGAHHEEAGKLVREDVFDLVGLLDLDAQADRVDRGFDQDLLVRVAGDDERGQEHFGCRAVQSSSQLPTGVNVPLLGSL